MVDRRTALTYFGVGICTGVSGCSSIATNTLYETRESVTLETGNFKWYGFRIEQPSTVEYTIEVTDGPNIDVLFLTRRNFEKYRDGNVDAVTYDSSLSVLNTASADATGKVEPGEYSLTIDNTGRIGADPSQESDSQGADVTFTVDFVVSRSRLG